MNKEKQSNQTEEMENMHQDCPSSTFINIMDKEGQNNQTEEQAQHEEDDCPLDLNLSLSINSSGKKMKVTTSASFPPSNNVIPFVASSSSLSSGNNNIHDLFAAASPYDEGQLNYTVFNIVNHQAPGSSITHLGPSFASQSLEPPPPPPHTVIRPRALHYAPAIPTVANHDQGQPQPHNIPALQRAPRNRRNRLSSGPNEDNEIFPPPFPWATDRFAKILTYDQILAQGIHDIAGDLQCKKCEQTVRIEFNLTKKFNQVGKYICQNKDDLYDRAPPHWSQPEYPSCPHCDQPNSLKPVIPDDRKMINWLFLLLGEMVGSCTIDDLRFFCKYTGNHRTGAKDRLIYLTYLDLCKQLDPTGPFEYHPNR